MQHVSLAFLQRHLGVGEAASGVGEERGIPEEGMDAAKQGGVKQHIALSKLGKARTESPRSIPLVTALFRVVATGSRIKVFCFALFCVGNPRISLTALLKDSSSSQAASCPQGLSLSSAGYPLHTSKF